MLADDHFCLRFRRESAFITCAPTLSSPKDATVCHRLFALYSELCRNVTKCTFWHMRPAKTQIRLRVRAVWSESSLGTTWILKMLYRWKVKSLIWRRWSKGWSDFSPGVRHIAYFLTSCLRYSRVHTYIFIYLFYLLYNIWRGYTISFKYVYLVVLCNILI